MGRLLIAAVACVLLSLPATLLGKVFMIPEELHGYSAPFPPGVLEKIEAAQIKADMLNMGLVGGMIGAIVCALLGATATHGGAGRKARAIVTGLIAGVALGAAGGAVSAVMFTALLQKPIDPFLKGILTQVGFSVSMGLGVALTLLCTARSSIKIQGMGAVIVCALIAAALYPFLASVVFPLNRSDVALPEGWGNRALWLGLPILLFAITIHRSSKPAVSES